MAIGDWKEPDLESGERTLRRTPVNPQWSAYQSSKDGSSQRRARSKLRYDQPTGTTWYMPVAGMKQAPGDFASGKGNWSRGSFGYQKPASKGGHVHTGTDIYAAQGTAIVAPVAGTVISVGNSSQGGNYVKIRGTDGIEYYFAHMQDSSPWSQGTKVQAGIFLGSVGTTGNASGTTPHLHFTMRKNGQPLSPNAFLETGRQQKHTPLSSIPGLNTPEEIANWAMTEARAQTAGQEAMTGGFDTGDWASNMQQQEQPDAGMGQRFLGSMLNAQSRRISGGERTPIPMAAATPNMSSSLSGASLVDEVGVPEAEAEAPALQRQQTLETERTDGR